MDYASFCENTNHPKLLQQAFTSVLRVVSNNNRPVVLKGIGKFSIVQNKTNHESLVALLLYDSMKHFKVQMLHERYFDPNSPHHCSNL